MAKKKNTYKKGSKEGLEMIPKSLTIPQETFDILLEAMIKEDKEKEKKESHKE